MSFGLFVHDETPIRWKKVTTLWPDHSPWHCYNARNTYQGMVTNDLETERLTALKTINFKTGCQNDCAVSACNPLSLPIKLFLTDCQLRGVSLWENCSMFCENPKWEKNLKRKKTKSHLILNSSEKIIGMLFILDFSRLSVWYNKLSILNCRGAFQIKLSWTLQSLSFVLF